MIGTIVEFNPTRGFGYVLAASGRKYFAHIRNWESAESPKVGRTVMFDVGPGLPGKSSQAVNIHLQSDIGIGADALASKAGAE